MPQYAFSEIRDRLDDWRVFNNMVDSLYYRDAAYETFSDADYISDAMKRSGRRCASTVWTA
jgi:hypothetical protein